MARGSRASDEDGRSSPDVARHLVVHGRVQGVYFRAATRQTADRAGVTGWVRNRVDGTVEAWLEGQEGAVESVEAWVVTGGPPAAEVERVDVEDREPEGHRSFEVLRRA